ncbi:MAG TPA: aromatic ring-hydroxylating dioxygenase subunit alpha [Acidimicrobiales bacterium]|nr:aromatic ring-hydroxylating dioxygenase subunit alpha [Acidimicrobiales bacterium]
MNRTQLAGVRTLLDEDLDASALSLDEAVTLPPEMYTDADFFAFEKDAIFTKEWICVGRQEQIPNPGDYFSFTVADEPLVVVRDDQGVIRAMSAVCQHRGMVITDPGELEQQEWSAPVCERAGNCGRQLRCPYHFWVYDLTGQLVGAPEMGRTKDFDRSAIRLPRLAVEVWNGFVFVNFDLDAAPLAPRLALADDYLANWQMGEMEAASLGRVDGLPWNWKVMLENIIEIYHADRLHLPIHELAPASLMVSTPFDDQDAMVISRTGTVRDDYSFNASMGALFPVIDTLTPEDRSMAYFGIAPPTLGIGTSSDSLLYVLVVPRAADRIDLLYGTLFPKGYKKLRRFAEIEELASTGMVALTRQDVAANKSVQRGLRSQFAPRGRLSWQEEPINHFNRWLITRYRRHMAALG